MLIVGAGGAAVAAYVAYRKLKPIMYADGMGMGMGMVLVMGTGMGMGMAMSWSWC